MLTKLKSQNNKGFTIIEVMIVLAIAGLILLVVLLAVPALQRNARNTTLRSDVGAVTAGINEFRGNNEGVSPTTYAVTGANVAITGIAGTTASQAKVQGGTVIAQLAAAPTSDDTVAGKITVLIGFKCGSQNSHLAAVASPRSAALLYAIETAATPAPRCADA